MQFYIGLHVPGHCSQFSHSMVSVNRLRYLVKHFTPNKWILDSGAFTEISKYGEYRHSVATYAKTIEKWRRSGTLHAVVSQDYMCEPFILKRWGTTVREHQVKTVLRYLELQSLTTVYIMPVLQGYTTYEYLEHIEMYIDYISPSQWIGVGSVCKRNTSDPQEVYRILSAIKNRLPDIKLHGFGLKANTLKDPNIYSLLHSADSMAWSLNAKLQGRDPNDINEALRFWRELS